MVSTNITINVEFVFDHVSIIIESVTVESIKNSIPHEIISNSAYLLALNIFISKISKETLNSEELKQGHLKPVKEETQSVNLGTDDVPKMVQIGNILNSSENDALVTLLKEFTEVFAWSYKICQELIQI